MRENNELKNRVAHLQNEVSIVEWYLGNMELKGEDDCAALENLWRPSQEVFSREMVQKFEILQGEYI